MIRLQIHNINTLKTTTLKLNIKILMCRTQKLKETFRHEEEFDAGMFMCERKPPNFQNGPQYTDYAKKNYILKFILLFFSSFVFILLAEYVAFLNGMLVKC